MSKAYDDLLEVRILFEEFERKLIANVDKSVAKHGSLETISVAADVARIRRQLHDLHLKMFPYVEPPIEPMTDEECKCYFG